MNPFKSHNNHNIECSIYTCANHSKNDGYCALNKIKVGTHEDNPTEIECTDCQSFERT
ncbi:DUF1540 domain-containing protein [Ruminiclostridium cellobioparum]|uniref:DUF1540 domain-containing protein n=1 Tax=Ruminiclostridium cellobioparum TaxID=29355 RepID=UPI0028A6BAB3|nr:DUF1540 domain-containing protein [Ruminiclostridium cellobioparum]